MYSFISPCSLANVPSYWLNSLGIITFIIQWNLFWKTTSIGCKLSLKTGGGRFLSYWNICPSEAWSDKPGGLSRKVSLYSFTFVYSSLSYICPFSPFLAVQYLVTLLAWDKFIGFNINTVRVPCGVDILGETMQLWDVGFPFLCQIQVVTMVISSWSLIRKQ